MLNRIQDSGVTSEKQERVDRVSPWPPELLRDLNLTPHEHPGILAKEA